MSYEFVIQGTLRRTGGDKKEAINRLVQKRFSSNSALVSAVLKGIFNHPYLHIDDWGTASHRDNLKRYKRCQELIGELKSRLSTGEVLQLGLDDVAGSPHLTSEKLSNRRVWLLNQPGWLLIKLERHPAGGSPTVWEQTWLYDRHSLKVHLIDGCERALVLPERIRVQSGGGPWQPASTELRDSFFKMIETDFGPDWVEQFEQAFQFQEVPLVGLSDDITTKCHRITGTDWRAEEQRKYEMREFRYLSRYGSRPKLPRHLPINVSAGIRLVYAKS